MSGKKEHIAGKWSLLGAGLVLLMCASGAGRLQAQKSPPNKFESERARISLVQRRADSRPQVCSACSGIGVLSYRNPRIAGATAKASRLFGRAIHDQAQAGQVCARKSRVLPDWKRS